MFFLSRLRKTLQLLCYNLSSSLSDILANRLVLNLRKTGNQHNENLTTVSQPKFVTNGFLDNIGAPLRYGSEDVDIGDGLEEYELEEYHY